MHTIKVKSNIVIITTNIKPSYALHIISVIFVPVYLTSVCVVLAPMTSLQDGELHLFQAESGTEY